MNLKLMMILAGIAASFSAGWYISSTIAENKALRIARAQQQAIEDARMRADKAEMELINIKPEIREVIREVTNEVVSYVPVDNCELDSEWLRISSDATNAANSTSRPASK